MTDGPLGDSIFGDRPTSKRRYGATLAIVLAVDWTGVVLAALASLLVGIALWLFLPRGVVLTKVHPASLADGAIIPDSWRLTNDSAVSARILCLRESGPWCFKGDDWEPPLSAKVSARLNGRRAAPSDTVPVEGGKGVRLRFDDHVLDTRREDRQQPWAGQIVPPGESLTLIVGNMATAIIDYRRAGLFGLLERRSIVIHGLG